MNTLKTVMLMAGLTVLLIMAGNAIGGRAGMLIAFIFAAGMNFASYWFSDKIVLKMYRAKEVNETAAPKLYGLIRTLTTKARLPMPKVTLSLASNPMPLPPAAILSTLPSPSPKE